MKSWLCRNNPTISGNGFSGSGEEGGEGAGVTRGKRKQEADRLKEARALVSTRQAHERTHKQTYGQGGTGEQTHAQLQKHTHKLKMDRVEPGEYNTHTRPFTRRANASKSCLTLGWLKVLFDGIHAPQSLRFGLVAHATADPT